MGIPHEELKKVPYLDCNVIGDRTVNLMSLWDGSNWHSWVPIADSIVNMQIVNLVSGDYVAKDAEHKSDLRIPFIDFMWQQASWPEVCWCIDALREDFHNMATSVAKIQHFYVTRELISERISSFVAIEIEYLLMLARSVFDLLQEAIANLWNTRLQLLDEAAEKRRKGRELQKTFSKIILPQRNNPETFRTKQEIEAKFDIPSLMAEQYEKHSTFFLMLRSARDKIVHGGSSVPHIFSTEKGFCVYPNASIFRGFNGWTSEHYFNENIVLLMPWIAYIIFHTIDACNEIMTAFATQVKFPPPIAPGYSIFVRNCNNDALIELSNIWHEIEG